MPSSSKYSSLLLLLVIVITQTGSDGSINKYCCAQLPVSLLAGLHTADLHWDYYSSECQKLFSPSQYLPSGKLVDGYTHSIWALGDWTGGLWDSEFEASLSSRADWATYQNTDKTWWHMSEIITLGKQRQRNQGFSVILSDIVCLK